MKLTQFVFGMLTALYLGFASAAVNINTASAKELEALPGIGATKAQAIVDYRTQNGAFKSVNELDKVKGIGPKMLEKLRSEATIGNAPVKPATPAKKLDPSKSK